MQELLPHAGRLPGGDDHSGVRHRYAEHGHQLAEDGIGQGIGEILRGDVLRRAYARNAYGVRAYAPARLEVLGVHKHSNQFVHVIVKAEEDSYAHVVAASFLGAVHCLRMPVIIALGACGMEGLVLLLVIGLLEEDIGSDSGGLELAVGLHVSGGNVHVHPADGVASFFD